MLKIGDFSKLSRVSIRMLRHYDQMGLLHPARTDGFTGYRYYSESQLPRAARIASLRDMGFGLTDITTVMESDDRPEVLQHLFESKRAETQAETDQAQQRLHLLDSALERLRKEIVMEYSVNLKEIPQRYVASVRQIIPSYQDEGLLWNTLMGETKDMKLQGNDPCYSMALFHDAEYKESDVDVEVQIAVRGTYADTKHVVFKTEPAVLVASATYQGSYEQIDEVNQAVAKWVHDNGYAFAGPMFTIYHVSPHETSDPSKFVTEVCYPVSR